MKKLLSVTVIITVLLCGCTVQPEEIEINRCFSAEAKIQYQSTAFTADFTSDENGCSAVFSSPAELSGMKIEFNGTDFTYTLGELSFSSGIKNENRQFLRALYDALRDPNAVIAETESGYTVQGVIPLGSYYLNINKEQHTPVFFEIEEIGLTVSF